MMRIGQKKSLKVTLSRSVKGRGLF
uniref:Uncharacterized protein n=1 Tax=Arundo donax TaxID=35708 RepID=A0A0A9FUL6_ARUDO